MASAPLEESGFDDDLESLLNYDVNAPDASNDKNAQPELKSGESSNQATTTNVDEEVKIVKKRQPVPKLDQAR
jgi:replication fork protection complex subunit Csm3/Swi3